MEIYISKYSNEFGDEWIFEFDYSVLAGTLTGSDIDWTVHQVLDGKVPELNLYQDEKQWLKSV
ncbi:MAG: hypothetical protein KME13_08785 [Myxacorys californica WJT36-NPBG1]|jgi:hypothetical protein|nr:hypothetical protein [Myxacorys californica WJT36-NPBG1]